MSGLAIRHGADALNTHAQLDGSLHIHADDRDYLVSENGDVLDCATGEFVGPADPIRELLDTFRRQHHGENMALEPDFS